LDVTQMRRWATGLARVVSVVGIPGAMHDVVLSRPGVRARAYEELNRWSRAYLTG